MFIARFDIQNSPWVVSKPPLGEARPCLPSRTPGCFKVSMKARNWPSVETSSQQIEQILSYFVPLLHHLFFSFYLSRSFWIGFHSLQSSTSSTILSIQTKLRHVKDHMMPKIPVLHGLRRWHPIRRPRRLRAFEKDGADCALLRPYCHTTWHQTLAGRNKLMEEWIHMDSYCS